MMRFGSCAKVLASFSTTESHSKLAAVTCALGVERGAFWTGPPDPCTAGAIGRLSASRAASALPHPGPTGICAPPALRPHIMMRLQRKCWSPSPCPHCSSLMLSQQTPMHTQGPIGVFGYLSMVGMGKLQVHPLPPAAPDTANGKRT